MNSLNEKEMKKIFLYGVTVLAIGVLAAVNVTLGNGKKTLNDLQLANVEALADYEVGPPLSNWKEYTIGVFRKHSHEY
jgi:hypothetical protein